MALSLEKYFCIPPSGNLTTGNLALIPRARRFSLVCAPPSFNSLKTILMGCVAARRPPPWFNWIAGRWGGGN